jgi:hypothetical protein
MAITERDNAFVDATSVSIGLSQMFNIASGSSNPTYVVLSLLDRDEYTAGASGATGTISGNGHTATFSNVEGDGRGIGITFTYQASTGRYYNSTYGYLDQVTYTSSSSRGDVTDVSLFGTNSLSLANTYASDPYDLMEVDPNGYIGTASVVTRPGYTAAVPGATPDSIAAMADSFVGQAWNTDGCWVLASTIAAEAGAALPSQSTVIGLPGQSNGEWIVAFNGPAGASGNWQSLVHVGEMIVIGTPGGGGHITTCVSGSGSTAMLVDNVTYVNAEGQIQNLANDGSANDVSIASPHAASQEWAGVQASSVVIYELDTPIVSDLETADTLALLASQSLASLFSATDPGNRSITAWQVYDTAGTDMLALGGVDYSDHSATSALTAYSLGVVSLVAGATQTTDTLEVRAFNGLYWGDWQSLSATIAGAAPARVSAPASPPVLETQTAAQTWLGGRPVSFALPAGTFLDPQGETLRYAATQANGQPLPAWLSFNPTTKTFSGTAPTTTQSFGIKVTATDTSGLSASETFNGSVQAPVVPVRPGITVTDPTPNQSWTEGQAITFGLPANTFTDALGLKMSFAAYEQSGPNITSWLRFNPTTDTFSGTPPLTLHGTAELAVIASDAQHMTAADIFDVTFVTGSGRTTAGTANHGGSALSVQFEPKQVTSLLAFHS